MAESHEQNYREALPTQILSVKSHDLKLSDNNKKPQEFFCQILQREKLSSGLSTYIIYVFLKHQILAIDN